MYKVFSILFFAFAFLGNQTFAQETPKEEDGLKKELDKLVFGGTGGLQFGTVTLVNVAPTVAYPVQPRWLVGFGPNYTYYSDSRIDLRSSIYGGSVFTRYFFTESLFGHAEYESLNGEWFIDRDRFWANSILLGGGYNYRIANGVGINIMGLLNLSGEEFSPYGRGPIFRGGVNFGM